MPQVVTSENFAQLVETGRVDEFVPPDQPRSADGKFAAAEKPAELPNPEGVFANIADESGKSVDKPDEKANVTDAAKAEDDDKDLPERVRQQINKKHRQMREAEELSEYIIGQRDVATKRAEQAEAKLREIEAQSRPATVEVKEPKPEDFATVAEYTEALVNHKWEAKQAQEAKAREDAAKLEREQTYAQRVAETRKAHPDFDQVMKEFAESGRDRVHTDLVEYIQESEYGPRLQLHLAQHSEDLQRLQKLSPRQALAFLGKLEAKLEKPAAAPAAPAKTPVATVSQAPAPIAPLDGKSSEVEKDPSKMNVAELKEFRRQETLKRRR